MAVASMDGHIYLLQFHITDFFHFASCSLERDFAVNLNFSEDSSMLTLFTNRRKVMMVNVANFREFLQEERANRRGAGKDADLLQRSGPAVGPVGKVEDPVSLAPAQTCSPRDSLSLGNTSNCLICGDENGNVYLFKAIEDIKNNIGPSFAAHTSPVQDVDFTMDDSKFFSVGSSDRTMILWRLDKLQEGDEGKEEQLEKQQATIIRWR